MGFFHYTIWNTEINKFIYKITNKKINLSNNLSNTDAVNQLFFCSVFLNHEDKSVWLLLDYIYIYMFTKLLWFNLKYV